MNIGNALNFDPQAAINFQNSDSHLKSSESFIQQFHELDSSLERQLEAAGELQENFRKFVGTTLYGQMLKSMRNTVGKPAYMHGGRTEEIFQQQLDQILVEDLTKKSAATIADPMFELFNMRRTA